MSKRRERSDRAFDSRRGLLKRAASSLVAVAGASAVVEAMTAAEAEAQYYTFCGHTWTTASCPHPTGLPRVDARGYPLRATDGRPVDDLGRPIDKRGVPIGPNGPLRDADGRTLPPAPRSKVCTQAVAERFGMRTYNDGAWYRCCGGHVRKLVDCCANSDTRINGDEALEGYCYSGRKVFCVQYYDTKTPC